VRENEEVAMKLVAKYTDLPLPKVFPEESAYFTSVGILAMSHISGSPLDASWDRLDEHTKERVCIDIWNLITKIQTILKPPEFSAFIKPNPNGSNHLIRRLIDIKLSLFSLITIN